MQCQMGPKNYFDCQTRNNILKKEKDINIFSYTEIILIPDTS